MSYILDALKKLEHEKSRKTGDKGTGNICGDLLREHKPSGSGGGGTRRIIIIVVVASLATFGTTWFVLKGTGKVPVISLPASQAVNQPAMPAPVPVEPAVQTPPVTPAAAGVQAPPVAAVVPQAAPAVPATREAAVLEATQEDNDTPRGRRHKNKRPVPVPVRQDQAGAGTAYVPPPVDIKLSGIAWQDERSVRRAVVNGMLMKEGSIVAGAKITEIFKDRVRFSLSGSFFEISLLASGMTGPGK